MIHWLVSCSVTNFTFSEGFVSSSKGNRKPGWHDSLKNNEARAGNSSTKAYTRPVSKGACLGIRLRPSPFCVKSAEAPEAWGRWGLQYRPGFPSLSGQQFAFVHTYQLVQVGGGVCNMYHGDHEDSRSWETGY